MRINNQVVHMTPSERRLGRLLRAPEGHVAEGGGGGGDSTSTGNNGGGNSNDSSNGGGQSGNNSGQGFDFNSFWGQPSGGNGNGSSSGGSATNSDSSGGQGNGGNGNNNSGNSGNGGQQNDAGAQLGQRFAQTLQNIQLPQVFNDQVASQIAEGNLQGVNEALQNHGREAIRQSVMMNAQLMQAFGQSMMAQVRELIQGQFGNKETEQHLLENFPAAKNPVARPIIESVYHKALEHSNGDRGKAVELAKSMLQLVGKEASSDFGFQTPPGDREDGFGGAGATSLVEELLGRTQ